MAKKDKNSTTVALTEYQVGQLVSEVALKWSKQLWKRAKRSGLVVMDSSKTKLSPETFEETVKFISRKADIKGNTEVIHHGGVVLIIRTDFIKKRTHRPCGSLVIQR